MSFADLIRINKKNGQIETMQDWMLVAADTGAWEGVRDDWESSHAAALSRYVKNFGTVVQAGGNMGIYPYLLGKFFQRVYTFEPDPLNFHCLVNNCQLDNIIKINAAVGAEHVMISVKKNYDWNCGMHQVLYDKDNGVVPQLMIDDLALQSCDLVWLDIEGYEVQALLGAYDTINKHKPIVMVENGGKDALDVLPLGYKEIGKSRTDTIYST